MSGPLSILQVLTHASISSGGAMQAFLLSRELAKRGHRVTVATHRTKDEAAAKRTREKIEAAGCRHYTVLLKGMPGVASLARLLRAERNDVVHLHRERALQCFVRAARLAPDVAAIANVGTSKPPDAPLAAAFRSRRIDRIVAVAEALKRVLVRGGDVDPARIQVVYGAFDESRFRLDAPDFEWDRLELPAGAKRIGVVANFDGKKGHKHLLRAMRDVLARIPDCCLLFAGRGDAEPMLEAAAEIGVPRERLRVLGFVDNVAGLLKGLDVSVSSSIKGEGVSGSMRESLAMGTPVVATAVAGNVEIMRHRATALLVPPKDDEALAAAIVETLEQPAAARERAALGQAEVRARLTVAQRADRIEELYREVVFYRRVRATPVSRFIYPDPREWRG